VVDKKQPENVEHFNYLGKMKISAAMCTREIKTAIAMGKAAFNKETLFTENWTAI
jgi:hypothetical protein